MKKTFEEQLQEIESIVDRLDSGEESLESMLKLYESGMKLIKGCQATLDKAEQKVRVIDEKYGLVNEDE